jgi:ring-1,2-phenylacetyl-CoA epoxidase subunit PaaD
MSLALARRVASSVADPEIPQLTLADLGILRDVALDDGRVTVSITPTYLGCPALHEIEADLRERLQAAGFPEVTVRVELAPRWTSDDITEAGRRKLAAAGIAPPRSPAQRAGAVALPLIAAPHPGVPCPHCGSEQTNQLAPVGATACKALHRCRSCGEPFEYVKDI